MVTSHRTPRRKDALSRDVIVTVAIEILDAEGEDALTLRTLTQRLSTGYGAIYHHVTDREDLLAAATDRVVEHIATSFVATAEPRDALRDTALRLFDAVVAHPWVGAQLVREPWRPVLLDIYEHIGAHLRALPVPQRALSDSASVLLNYVLGVAGQNAANARALAAARTDRSAFLADVAARWSQLDPERYRFVREAGAALVEHDDRDQFRTGIDIIITGIEAAGRAGDGGSSSEGLPSEPARPWT
jgi:AcrR family transcriptional regulator